jgi:hypothetical protein
MKMMKDPKDYITPYAFGVDQSLLGLPLAKPRRRLTALLLDLLLAAIVASFGGLMIGTLLIGGYIFTVWKRSEGGVFARLRNVRVTTILLLLLATAITSALQDDDDGVKPVSVVTKGAPDNAPGTEIDWHAFGKAMAQAGSSDSVKASAAIAVLEEMDTSGGTSADTTRDAKTIARLKKRVAALEEEQENRGILSSVKQLLEDAGLSAGWIALYFVLFPTWTNGQTPAKSWLRIRVIKLNAKPLTWWNSFERFGGYSAGIATGLLGFAQIYWDPNRQTIHDKITETVVVDLRKERMPLDHIGPLPA